MLQTSSHIISIVLIPILLHVVIILMHSLASAHLLLTISTISVDMLKATHAVHIKVLTVLGTPEVHDDPATPLARPRPFTASPDLGRTTRLPWSRRTGADAAALLVQRGPCRHPVHRIVENRARGSVRAGGVTCSYDTMLKTFGFL